MPGLNGMGPTGEGPRTGRGLGRCTGTADVESSWRSGRADVSGEYPMRPGRRFRDFVPGAGRGRGIHRRSR